MSDVEQVVETSAQQVHITEPANPEATVDAASLGVDQASFDKYYKEGNFDWASYGKEQAFKASQEFEATKEATTEEVQPEAAAAVADAGLDWNSFPGINSNEESGSSTPNVKTNTTPPVPISARDTRQRSQCARLLLASILLIISLSDLSWEESRTFSALAFFSDRAREGPSTTPIL